MDEERINALEERMKALEKRMAALEEKRVSRPMITIKEGDYFPFEHFSKILRDPRNR